MRLLNIYVGLIVSLCSSQITAGTLGTSEPASISTVLTASVGPVFEAAGQTQTFYLQPDLQKTYQATNHTNTLVNGELWLGKQFHWPSDQSVLTRLGVAVAATNHAFLSGDVWDDANPNFDNFTYNGSVDQVRLMLEGKWLYAFTKEDAPYASVGVGFGFNHSYHFMITPNISEQVAPPVFDDHTNTAFTYTLGLGWERQWTANCSFAIGYEFADWGKSLFAAAPGQTLGTGPVLSHLYTHELQFSLIYMI